MKEILGNNLKIFFDKVDPSYKNAEITYANDRYEVWNISGELFERMCNMTEEEFAKLSERDDAWWRSADGSNLSLHEKGEFTVNNKIMVGWKNKPWQDNDKEYDNCTKYTDLSEYLCEHIGVSLPRNVVSCAMDLAKYNNMSMAELFQIYEDKR